MPPLVPRQLVRLKYDTLLLGGGLLPAGSVGTVLQTYAEGFLVDVRFLDFRDIRTVAEIELEPI